MIRYRTRYYCIIPTTSDESEDAVELSRCGVWSLRLSNVHGKDHFCLPLPLVLDNLVSAHPICHLHRQPRVWEVPLGVRNSFRTCRCSSALRASHLKLGAFSGGDADKDFADADADLCLFASILLFAGGRGLVLSAPAS